MSTGALLLVVGVFLGVVGVFVVVAVVAERAAQPKASERLRAIEGLPALPVDDRKLRRQLLKGATTGAVFTRLMRALARPFKLRGGISQSRVQEMLVHAGIREKGAVEVFLGAKLALTLAMPAAVIAFLMWGTREGLVVSPRHMFMYGAIGMIAGLMLPNLWLRGRAQSRIRRVRLSLPDALDLLIVCIESGLGLDAALVRISQELADVAPELCEELALLNLEVSAGRPRQECLRHLALRTGCEEVESLTARINQAAKFGTNLGDSLRIHSETLRRRRRQEAEEKAAKTTVKLLFPLVFFIFPAVFVVILGPAFIRLADELLSRG
jgi:tight adherence protein C